MKKLIIIFLVVITISANAQVIIGDAKGTAPVKTSVLLEFAQNQNKGIIVPYVRNLPTAAALVGGSIILDATVQTAARMKFYNGTSWIDLSGQGADITSTLVNQPTGVIEAATSKAIIGASASSADGVLVLESSNLAMVLPTVSDVANIPSPSPGMMVYVNKSGSKRLAVYNGKKWSFWQS